MWDWMVPSIKSRKKLIKHRYIVFVTEKDFFILRDFAGFIHRLNMEKQRKQLEGRSPIRWKEV